MISLQFFFSKMFAACENAKNDMMLQKPPVVVIAKHNPTALVNTPTPKKLCQVLIMLLLYLLTITHCLTDCWTLRQLPDNISLMISRQN